MRQQHSAVSCNPGSSPRIDEQQLDEIFNAIGRLRGERDELSNHLEFAQMEAQFKIEALESQLSQKGADIDPSHAPSLRSNTYDKVRLALPALAVSVQHLETQNVALANRLAQSQFSDVHLHSNSSEELISLQTKLHEQEAERSRLSLEVASLEDKAQEKNEHFEEEVTHLSSVLASKEEQIADVNFRLTDAIVGHQQERDRRTVVEAQLRDLQVEYDTLKQELADVQENCDQLEARQASGMSSNAITASLRNEIQELKSRILRRTEQIGLHQHDIKRLETNLSLSEERQEEMANELETLRMENAAMLEDCSVARNDRDNAQSALASSEQEFERLSSLIKENEEAAKELQATIASLNDEGAKSKSSHADEVAALTTECEERDNRITSLLGSIAASKAKLVEVQDHVTELTSELASARAVSERLTSEDQKRELKFQSTLAKETELRDQQLKAVETELGKIIRAHNEAQSALQRAREELERNRVEVEELQSKVEAAEREAHDNRSQNEASAWLKADLSSVQQSLCSTKEELKRRFDELRATSDQLCLSEEEKANALRMAEAKAAESASLKQKVEQLSRELEKQAAAHQNPVSDGCAKDHALKEMQDKAATFETERIDLLTRLSEFEQDSQRVSRDKMALQSTFEEENARYAQKVAMLEEQVRSLESQVEQQTKALGSSFQELEDEQDTVHNVLDKSKKELEELNSAHELLLVEHSVLHEERNKEVQRLQSEIDILKNNVDQLQRALEKDNSAHRQDTEALQAELRTVKEEHNSFSDTERELRQKISSYERQLEEVRSELMAIKDENNALQSDLDQVNAERQRACLENQSLAHKLHLSKNELSDVHKELVRMKDALAHSEKSGKGAEMKLLLMSQQNERTITALRAELKEHEKDGERIQTLQRYVGEMKEQIGEMEVNLRSKNAEIEENDDKFIQ
jgi:chromosome segregation ATPase